MLHMHGVCVTVRSGFGAFLQLGSNATDLLFFNQIVKTL